MRTAHSWAVKVSEPSLVLVVVIWRDDDESVRGRILHEVDGDRREETFSSLSDLSDLISGLARSELD